MFMDSDTATESNLSLRSLSFLHRVNDWLRKMLDHSKDAMQDIDKRSLIWECLCLQHWKHLYSWEWITQTILHSIRNTGKDLTLKQMFDISEKLTVGQSDEIFRVSQINWEDAPWRQLSLVNDEEVISLACKDLCLFRFCVMSWKSESEPNIKFCLGRTVGLVQRFITIHNFGRADGIRVGYFPGFTTLQLCYKVQEFMTKNGRPIAIPKDELSSCRCFMTSYGDLKTMNGNAMQTPHVGLYKRKDFQQDVGHSSDLDQKQSGILLALTDHVENGTESLNWWWSNSEKADTQFSEPRVHCPKKRSKANEVEYYQYTSVPMAIRLKPFFAQLFLLSSSVSTEQSPICVRNTVPVKQEPGDPYWQSNLTHCSRQQTYW